MAAGLAAVGKRPYVCAPANFLSARSLEQIKVDVAYSGMNVKLLAVSGGVSYGALGASHHATHDIAVLRAVPGLAIVLPCAEVQTAALLRELEKKDVPAYVRLGKQAMPLVYPEGAAFRIGRAVTVRDGNDATIVACGEMVHPAVEAAVACLAGRDPACVEAVALSSQRESMLLWERKTGKPLSQLVSWQDRRSVEECERLRARGHADLVRERSGLPLDPMFSALKAQWLLDVYDPDRSRARNGEICLGTVDSFLHGRFAGDEHLIERGNASRTQLLNVRRGEWDDELLDIFAVPRPALPQLRKSTGPFPPVRGVAGLRDGTPVLAALGDSHAALFGHGAFKPGQVKATYGTGSSVMGLLSGDESLHPGICLTIAWDAGKPALAAEANIRSSGATLRWLANLLAVEPGEVAELARRQHDAGRPGSIVIPGLNGLGAPWWDNAASGLIDGLTLDSSRESLALGALESIPHQITDVLEMLSAGGLAVRRLHADGGPT